MFDFGTFDQVTFDQIPNDSSPPTVVVAAVGGLHTISCGVTHTQKAVSGLHPIEQGFTS